MNDRHIIFLPNIPAKGYSFDPILRTRRFRATVIVIPTEHRR
jgi:hypothetical protein